MDFLLNNNQINIYPVLCRKLSSGRSNEEVLRAIISGGAKIVQYRDKEISKKEFYEEAKRLKNIANDAGVILIINDYVDVAKEIDADGVHLGQEDMLPNEARKILGNDKIIGVSTHNLDEAIKAEQDGATYINVGPIFKTNTKKNVTAPVGIEMFKLISNQIKIPISVMGGINHNNIKQVVQAGAKIIAVVSAVVSSDDIAQAVKTLSTQTSCDVIGSESNI